MADTAEQHLCMPMSTCAKSSPIKLALRLHVLCLLASLTHSIDVRAEVTQLPAGSMRLQGKLLCENGRPLLESTIDVNGHKCDVASDGRYSTVVPRNAIYSVKYAASQCYSIIHTFSDAEIASLQRRLPPVTLVRKKPGRVLLAFGGDTMMGRRFYEPLPGETQWIRAGHVLEDSQALLEHIKPYIELADYTSVNLESTLTSQKPVAEAEKAYTFYSHPETLPALSWAGVDYVCLGNNHIYDYLQAGLEATLSALDSSPISFSGAGLNETQAKAPHHERIQGVDFSFLGFVGWKGKSTPSQVAEGNEKGGAAHGDMQNIISAVTEEASSQAVVILQYHGGEEYSYLPTNVTQKRLRAAIDHGADLVVGHHPHVLQGFEIHGGKLIAYSLGNFLFDQYRYETQRSALLFVWMDGEQFHRAEVVPIHIQNYHATPGTGRIRDFVLRTLMQQSAANGVMFAASGGHGVIASESSSPQVAQRKSQFHVTPQLRGHQVRRLPIQWFQYLSCIESKRDDVSYRLGKDILLLGDFEQHNLFGLADNVWMFNSHDSGVVEAFSREGRCALKIAPPSSSEASIARQKHFIRFVDATPTSPMSLTGYVKSQGPATLSVCLDLWPSGWSQQRALEAPQEECLKTIDLAGDQWQKFVVDLEPLERSIQGFRMCLKNERNEQVSNTSIFVDDMALIAWEIDKRERAVSLDRPLSSFYNYISLKNGAAPCSPIVLSITNLASPTSSQ